MASPRQHPSPESSNRNDTQPGIEAVAPPTRAPSHDEIARRAYQLFEERGGEPGHEWEDWFRAERELEKA